MTTGLLSTVSWALAEEVVKATGVRLALGTRFKLLSIGWFAFFETLLKANALTQDFDFPSDQAVKVYSGAIFVSLASSIIHVYTSIAYSKAYNIVAAIIFFTAVHAYFNIYAADLDLVGATYLKIVVTSWVMSTIFDLCTIAYYLADRKCLSRYPI